jgi:hypothetical protein
LIQSFQGGARKYDDGLIKFNSCTFTLCVRSFTADYYLANPDAYLGKEVTLSVSSLNPRNEQPREDGLRQLDAQTSNQHKNGGALMVLAPPAIAASLIQLCGTNRSTKVGSKVTMIHGVFSQEKAATRRYYLLVSHLPRRFSARKSPDSVAAVPGRGCPTSSQASCDRPRNQYRTPRHNFLSCRVCIWHACASLKVHWAESHSGDT